MADAGQGLLGLMMSVGVLIVLPLYLISKETKDRQAREKEANDNKSDCP
jgi:hypothetical protein